MILNVTGIIHDITLITKNHGKSKYEKREINKMKKNLHFFFKQKKNLNQNQTLQVDN